MVDEDCFVKIECCIRECVKVHKLINDCVEKLDVSTFDDCKLGIVKLLRRERVLLRRLVDNLNNLFNCKRVFGINSFRIHRDYFIGDRYVIKPPLFLNKCCVEFQVLKKLLVGLHKEFFLNNGSICYQYSDVESHMWEIPYLIKDNELVECLRKQIMIL